VPSSRASVKEGCFGSLSRRVSRRHALKSMALAGAGTLVGTRAQAASTTLVVAGYPVEVVVAPVSRWTVRLSLLPLVGERPPTIPDDGSLVQSIWGPPALRTRSLGGGEQAICGDLVVKLSADPLTLAVEGRDGRLVQRLRVDASTGALTFPLGDAPLLGLGEGGPQFDRRGSTDSMKSGQDGYRLRTHGGRVPIQWLVGTGGWALFIHHPAGTFDFTGAEGRFEPRATGQPLDVFVVGAREPSQVMAEYALLTGRPEMPPRWTLGYQQSHRTLAGPEEVLSVARTFREKKLPCDALIYLGTGFTPSGWNSVNGSFTFNRAVFPDPEAMIHELHGLNFRVVLHAVILSRTLRGRAEDACDLKRFDEEEAGCYWNLHRRIQALGVDGWWPDEGDPLDAPARLTRNRMYWEGPQLDRPGERPYALHRNGHAGMQRYGAFLWSGDVYTTWETLRTQVPVAINTGLSGIPYWGTDIGGFVPTAEYTGELHVRWFQFGAFCPLFRSHGRTWHLRLPWGWNTGELGPNEVANYREGAANPDVAELHNPDVEPVCRKYLELRYRLMPYLYSAVRESHETGLPVMRALWLHHSDDAAASARGDEYLWGRDILVAPVTEKGATSRSLYLPRGRWYDFWTEERAEGGRETTRTVDLATLPLYVRAGAILPMGPVKQYTAEEVDAPLGLTVYPGADGAFTLYEDDGLSFDYRKGEWMGVRMEWKDAARRLSLRLAEGSRMRPPLRRVLEVRIAPDKATRHVVFDGTPVQVRLS
jgi:alpha-glucosidase (family GH31 glycosyl hydrolase)